MEKIIELKPIKEPTLYFEQLEERLKKHFKKLIYYPLLRQLELPTKTLQNAKRGSSPLVDALFRGQITFSQGIFSGQFNAGVSKELRQLGAKFDRKQGIYKLSYDQLPIEIKNVISASESKFQEKIAELDQKLSKILPQEVADSFSSEDLFDKTLFQADLEFQKNIKKVAVLPELTPSQRKKIASEWQNNMKLWIQNWTEEQIKELRSKVQESTLAGNRYGSLVKTIQDSYGVSADKAKFLARQETNLLLGTYKQTRYQEAGSKSYIWRCVHRPHDQDPRQHIPGNVRYMHGKLDGTEQKWDAPPIVSNPGQPMRRAHPGMDYNCRCYPRVLLRIG